MNFIYVGHKSKAVQGSLHDLKIKLLYTNKVRYLKLST
jgi:hypothetical protein